MEYKDIIQALRDYSELVEAGSQQFDGVIVQTGNTNADFENVVCAYVDALNEIGRVRNRNKRLCLIYDALGYEQYMIAGILHIAQQAVSKNLRWLKRFFK